MVAFDEVDLEDLSAREAGLEVVDVRNRIGVARGALVEVAVVSAWAGSAVFLGHHVEARARRRIRTSTDARGTHDIEILLGNPEFVGGQSSLQGQPLGIDEAFDTVARVRARSDL